MRNNSKINVNVLHVVSGLPSDGGGPSIVIPLTVLNENKHPGISSLLLCLYSKNPPTCHEYPVAELVTKNFVCFLRSFTYFHFSPSLFITLLFANYDVLHIHGSFRMSTFLSAFACIIRRKRYVITPHGSLVRGHLNKNKLIKLVWWNLVEKFVYMFAHSVRLLSKLEFSEIPSHISSFFTNISYIPNGIDFALISDYESKKIKQKYCADRVYSGKIKFLFFSRLSNIKGILELLSAWRIASESDPCFSSKCSLDLIGPIDDSIAPEISALIDGNNSVKYLGQVHGADRFKVLLRHDVFVLPTKGEGLSTALLEAISSYCSVITTKMCNLSDKALTKEFYYCQPTPASICEALLNFYSSFSNDEPISLEQREYVVAHYGWDNASNSLLKIYYD